MKEITKHRLKQVNKLLEIGLLTFCWLMACVGVASYSIYWIRQNVKEQEPERRELKPKLVNDDTNSDIRYYRLKDISFLESSIDYFNNQDYCQSYILLYQVQTTTSSRLYYNIDGDFNINIEGSTINFTRLFFDIRWYSSSDNGFLELRQVVLQKIVNGSVTDTLNLYYYSSNGSTRINTYIYFDFNSLRYNSYPDGVVQTYSGSIIDFYFTKLFSSADSSSFEFTKEYNFNSLSSDNITGDSNVIQPYKMNYRDDPSDSLIYFYIPFDFVSNNYLYKGIWLEFDKPIYIRINGEDKQVNFPSSTSQLMVKNVYYMRSLPATNTPDILPSASTMDLVASRYRYGQKQWNNGISDVYAFVYGTNYEFINDAYRLIYISDSFYNGYYNYYARPLPSNTDVSNSGGLWNPYLYRGLTLLQVLNNGYLTYELGTLTYSTNDIGLDNVFTLISSAFTGLLPILAIQVIPGISLGLLLFVPVIVTLIIVIFKLVRK